MHRVFNIIVLVLVLGIAAVGQSSKRSLDGYETGRVFDSMDIIKKESAHPALDAKNYLLEVWKEKRKAHFKVLRYSREGVRTTCEYFVEPSKRNVWQIAVACKSDPDEWGNDSPPSKERVFDRLVDLKLTPPRTLYGGMSLTLSNTKTGESEGF